MTFEEILDQAIAMLQRRGRLTYGMLKRQFQLDEDALNDLKTELLYAHPEVRDDAGRGLVWTPAAPVVAAETTGRFDAVLAAVTALLRCEGRVTYRRLTLACVLDTALLAAVCRELTFTQVAHDGHGEGVVWTGAPCAALPRHPCGGRQSAAGRAARPSARCRPSRSRRDAGPVPSGSPAGGLRRDAGSAGGGSRRQRRAGGN